MSMSALRRFLWEQDPRCDWCGKVTDLRESKGGKSHVLDATIDHYFSKYKQAERSKWGNPVVLACYKCNHVRGAKETKEQPKEVLWEKAGHSERMMKTMTQTELIEALLSL